MANPARAVETLVEIGTPESCEFPIRTAIAFTGFHAHSTATHSQTHSVNSRRIFARNACDCLPKMTLIASFGGTIDAVVCCWVRTMHGNAQHHFSHAALGTIAGTGRDKLLGATEDGAAFVVAQSCVVWHQARAAPSRGLGRILSHACRQTARPHRGARQPRALSCRLLT